MGKNMADEMETGLLEIKDFRLRLEVSAWGLGFKDLGGGRCGR